MRAAVVGALISGAAAGSLKLQWSDCGDASTHGHIKSLEPSTVTMGTKTPLAGKGSVDEAMTGATYKVTAKALGITVFSHTGDACKPDTIKLPEGAGQIDIKGFNCPIKAGDVELDMDLTLSKSIPTSLARVTIDLTATSSNGDKALCVQVKTSPADASHPPNYRMMWEHFKQEYGKFYNGDEEERFATFKANVDYIYDVNAEDRTYKLGINEFADMNADEFTRLYTGLKKPDTPWGDLPYLGRHNYSGNALDDAVDWTTKGAVTPVKNQGQCGSCWSFSTTGSLEGAWEIATGKLVSLSEQQFVDCDKSDHGCGGGLMDTAFGFAEKNALCTEESYSYTGHGGTCKASKCTVGIPKGDVTGFKDVAHDNEQALMEAISKGPVSIAIEADKPVFQMYKSGVLTRTCGKRLDHGVLAVGYGVENGQKYWKVKNSWGANWGDKGYVKLLRGKKGAGECGLLSQASYPVVAKKSVEESFVSGSSLKLAWSDCGKSGFHGHVTSLQPSTVTLGSRTTLVGKGTVDEMISGATYTMTAKAGWITVFSHTGDACKPDTIKLPAGAGEMNFKGFKCPLAPGNVELDLDLTLSKSIPSSLAYLKIDLTAKANNGDKAVCVELKTSPASEESEQIVV